MGSGGIKRHLITPIFGHEEDDDDDEGKQDSKSDEEQIPSRPTGNREPPPRRYNNFEFQMFGAFDIFRLVTELLTATNNNGVYLSEQHRMDEYISKGIMLSLICLICMILFGVI